MIDDKTYRIDGAWRIQRAQQAEAEEMREELDAIKVQLAELTELVKARTTSQLQAQRKGPRRAPKPTK